MKALKNMELPPAASSAPLTPSSKSWDHMPRKRRRLMGQMNLMLLIFLGCCISLILWPQLSSAAAADSSLQDFGSVTAKGENIFMLASSDSNNNPAGDDLGNAFPGSIQGKDHEYDDDDDDDGEDNDNHQGDATNGAKMPLMSNVRKEQASNEDIEMMQRLPQTSNMMPASPDHKPQSENNRHLRYQQIQQALREPITPLPPKHYHQRHHHHQQQHHNHHHQQQQHYRHHGKHAVAEEKKEDQEDEFKWPLPPPRSRQHYEHHLKQQHLRHHQRQHLHHHRRHNFTGTATTTSSTTTTTTMRPRYFDRDGLYSNPMAWLPATTQGPQEGEEETEGVKENKHFYNPHNRLFNDGGEDQQKQEDKEQEFKRISLSLDAQKDNSGAADNGDNFLKFDNVDDDLDDDDDYSYEDDNVDDNKSPSAPSPNTAKINVKRYTAPVRNNPYKPSASVASYSSRKRPQPHARNSFDEDYDSQVPNDNNNDNRDDDDTFSDEKWNKIEHEHYRKQQQHQRAMQALRSRRPSTGSSTVDTASNSVKNNKYPSAASKSTSSAKRPALNEDDSDNIYSRYYVPGTVTRKKEEELASPTSVL
ncbi:uncharacterized protein isoform X1 [Musca autumnalis]|uniref:uncharacterized protein isoform X1 n=1 Tax=Musca autumnalis TaxID=221902 RepID=UPI003CFAD9B7